MKKIEFHIGKIPSNYVYGFMIGIATLILIFRLFYLQVLHQSEYRLQSDQNRIREITLKPLRGLIFDRNGKTIVDNNLAFSLYAFPYYLQRNPQLYERLSQFVNETPQTLQKTVKKSPGGYFQPVRLARAVDFTIVSHVEEERLELPGVGFWIEPIRAYLSSASAAHMLGYLGEASPQELEKELPDGYQAGDIVGKKGLEKYYEKALHGTAGVRYVEVDVMGREVRTLENPPEKPPVPGDDLYLDLDLDLQVLAEQLMSDCRGSVIMMDLRDGGILAMVSKPDYPPQLFSGVIPAKVWSELQNDPNDPLYDRTIQSVFPPGSTFKLVLALAALSTHTIDPNWSISCPGYYRYGSRVFKCWKAKGHGRVNLYQAIQQSCNVYFYQLGLKVGIDNWSKYAKLLNFGQKTGIDLPQENSGTVPDRKMLDRLYGKEKWTQALMLNLAVGQGELVVTPLQMLQLAEIIAQKGRFYQPHLLDHTHNPLTGETTYVKVDSSFIDAIPEFAFDRVREGMRMVVQSGTGRAATVPNVEVAGKTGTAQNPHGKDHAWFVGFAPFDKPQVAIVVLVENGGGGGGVAAPKAGTLLKLYFSKNAANGTSNLLAQKLN